MPLDTIRYSRFGTTKWEFPWSGWGPEVAGLGAGMWGASLAKGSLTVRGLVATPVPRDVGGLKRQASTSLRFSNLLLITLRAGARCSRRALIDPSSDDTMLPESNEPCPCPPGSVKDPVTERVPFLNRGGPC
ncbi:hypothetical protein FOXB_13363 [Fusarium oxysporum f. sp. conglutinans Fo5176]|uniref:Uncharacterized protein n=1 Tax=Fusarium oxysporum (strain Fo5176) TaxID=660025 RepID=F9G3Y1_FUSOF|nr:hypothetical protein FOXB_13363 [Fusarium oxysporum f. sp. conglutinans Fo5176]